MRGRIYFQSDLSVNVVGQPYPATLSAAGTFRRFCLEKSLKHQKATCGTGLEPARWQNQQLKMLGCEYGQGYLFSRPVDNSAVKHLLARDSKFDADSDLFCVAADYKDVLLISTDQ